MMGVSCKGRFVFVKVVNLKTLQYPHDSSEAAYRIQCRYIEILKSVVIKVLNKVVEYCKD